MGAIAPGMRADITVLDDEHPKLLAREEEAALDSWIFSGGNACVKDMIVGGRHLVQDRRHIREDEILRNFQTALKRHSA